MGSRLSPPEVDRLLQLYQRASAHLVVCAPNFNDPALVRSAVGHRRIGLGRHLFDAGVRPVGQSATVLHPHLSRGRVACPPFRGDQRSCRCSSPRWPSARGCPTRTTPATWRSRPSCNRPTSKQDFENYYSSDAAAAVPDQGARQQHPGLVPRVRRRHRLLASPTAFILVDKRRQRRCRRRPVPGAGKWPGSSSASSSRTACSSCRRSRSRVPPGCASAGR